MSGTLERYLGSLLGLATADALGTTLEFAPPGTFTPVTEITGGGPFGLAAGQWTDDTAMALCLAESLTECQRFDPIDQLKRYMRWYREGHNSSTGTCFDIGTTTANALCRFELTGKPYCGNTDPSSAGNGSIMRLAPVPLFFLHDHREALDRSGESSRTTHGAIAAVDACRYLGGLIVGAVNGVDRAELLSNRYAPIAGYWESSPLCREIDDVACGSFHHKQPPQIVGSGYVVRSLEAALWAFAKTNSFREGCLLAVNLGDDADTTGAVYGQLAGAYYGSAGIPDEWKAKLAKKDLIETLAQRLYQSSLQSA